MSIRDRDGIVFKWISSAAFQMLAARSDWREVTSAVPAPVRSRMNDRPLLEAMLDG
jgi:hypothetical protein